MTAPVLLTVSEARTDTSLSAKLGSDSFRSEYANVVYDKPWLLMGYLSYASNENKRPTDVPEVEERRDLAVVIVLVTLYIMSDPGPVRAQ